MQEIGVLFSKPVYYQIELIFKIEGYMHSVNAINCICSHRSCLQAQHSFLKQRIFIAAKHDPDFILFYVSLFISILDDIIMYTGSLEL